MSDEGVTRSTTDSTKRHTVSWRRRDWLVGYAFVAPTVLGSVILVLVPLCAVIWFSLNDWNVLASTFKFVGLDNYTKLAADPLFHSSIRASLVFSAGLVTFNVTLALGLAVLLNQKLPGTTAFRTFFFSPVVVSLVAWSVVWGFMLQLDGGINGFLAMLGIDGPNWLRNGPTAMIAVIVVQVFKNVGLNMILFLAALQGVPQELYEAAQIDRAGPWRQFRSITVPMISPTLLLVTIITVIGSLEVFAQISVLTKGGPGTATNVLVYFLYQQGFQYHKFGYASAIGVVLFVIVLLLTLLQWQSRKKWVHDEV
ncbi:MAG: sugar ABC transporter permease [Propionibacteriaceae bacterium]|jgi:multiple sugar transport system permease protein|nr:sugar ABC transporter permease [Propionibacteriaceae bacterium]